MTTASRSLFGFSVLLAALALGCELPEEGDDHDVLAQTEPSIDAGLVGPEADAAFDLDAGPRDAARPDAGRRPDPNRPYLADVVANGTGCPRGSWDATIGPDGTTFTLTFSKYEVVVEPGRRLDFKDCNLTIKLHSPTGMSYAVSDIFFEGYAFLEEGVKGFQTANYYFQGNPVPSADKEKRTDLTGPVDRSYLFRDGVRDGDVVWSPCGLDRNLQIVTRLGLQKKSDAGSGYINMHEIRGLKLIWRKC